MQTTFDSINGKLTNKTYAAFQKKTGVTVGANSSVTITATFSKSVDYNSCVLWAVCATTSKYIVNMYPNSTTEWKIIVHNQDASQIQGTVYVSLLSFVEDVSITLS